MEIPANIINYILLCAAGVFGWVIRTLWTATEELKNDLAKLKEEMPKTYLLKEDYRDDIREIKDMLKEIFKELKNKEDKIIR